MSWETDSFTEIYEYTNQVDGTTYSVCFFLREKIPTLAYPLFKLEILDTAGADQFRTLNEKYIKVRCCFIVITRDPNASPR